MADDQQQAPPQPADSSPSADARKPVVPAAAAPLPRMLGALPGDLRAKLRERLRGTFDQFFDTYLEPWYLRRQQFAKQQPDKTLDYYYEARWALEQLYSPFSDAKRNPVKAFEKHYVIPKAEPNGPVDPVDGLPIVPTSMCTPFHAKDSATLLQVGRDNVAKMRTVLRDGKAKGGDGDLSPDSRILDFGCYCGNMMRALGEFTDEGEVWGADLDGDPVTWAMTHLTPKYRFMFTSSSAHLPFEDRYFDLIYCGSVFSHIEAPDAWLAELSRILRPGGQLYVTMIDKPALAKYIKEWPDVSIAREATGFMTKEQLESDYAQMVINRSPWQHAIFDREFFLNKARQTFDVVSVAPFVYSYQTAVLLTKRDTARRRPAANTQAEIKPAGATAGV